MEVPIKFVYDKRDQRCSALVGTAKRGMLILERMMAFQNLQQLQYRFEPYPGAEVICSKIFGTRVVKINVGAPSKPHEKATERRCVCNCNFSVGFIFEIEAEKLDHDSTDKTPLYTVMACVGTGLKYKLFEHILASDFTQYEIGQKVLLVPYNDMAYLCCSDAPQVPPTGCAPIISTDEVDDTLWRTTYRIIPWCALLVPKWVRREAPSPYG